jgi:hypothetical protein
VSSLPFAGRVVASLRMPEVVSLHDSSKDSKVQEEGALQRPTLDVVLEEQPGGFEATLWVATPPKRRDRQA